MSHKCRIAGFTLAAFLLLIAMPILSAGCGPKKEHAAAAPEVVVTEAVTRDVPLVREWIGTTDGNVNAHIHPKVQGYLKVRNYKEGSIVRENDLMFTIDERQYKASADQARGTLAQAQANLSKSRLDVEKYAPLVKEGAVSQQEYDNAVQTNRANEAAVQAAQASLEQASLNLGWAQVRSPISGIAGLAVAQVGDLVDTNTQLTTVSQIDPIKVVFPISENEYLFVAKKTMSSAGKAAVKPREDEEGDAPFLTLVLNDGTEFPHKGRISVADNQIDPRTGTITINGIFPNPDLLLRPGQYARVRANVKTLKGVVMVPAKAVMEVQSETLVVVVGADNKADFRKVKCGDTVEGLRAVTEGLKTGEKVVVEGLMKVKPGITVKPSAAAAGQAGAGK
jgi:membrane fusion protein (multidrug efflux system)